MVENSAQTEETVLGPEESAEAPKRPKANEGDTITIKRGVHKGKTGRVLKVRDNSVIVEIGMNQKTGEPIKTVVNHKNYKNKVKL